MSHLKYNTKQCKPIRKLSKWLPWFSFFFSYFRRIVMTKCYGLNFHCENCLILELKMKLGHINIFRLKFFQFLFFIFSQLYLTVNIALVSAVQYSG